MEIGHNFSKFVIVNCYFKACSLLYSQLNCQNEDDITIWNHRVNSSEYFSSKGRTEEQTSRLFSQNIRRFECSGHLCSLANM